MNRLIGTADAVRSIHRAVKSIRSTVSSKSFNRLKL